MFNKIITLMLFASFSCNSEYTLEESINEAMESAKKIEQLSSQNPDLQNYNQSEYAIEVKNFFSKYQYINRYINKNNTDIDQKKIYINSLKPIDISINAIKTLLDTKKSIKGNEMMIIFQLKLALRNLFKLSRKYYKNMAEIEYLEKKDINIDEAIENKMSNFFKIFSVYKQEIMENNYFIDQYKKENKSITDAAPAFLNLMSDNLYHFTHDILKNDEIKCLDRLNCIKLCTEAYLFTAKVPGSFIGEYSQKNSPKERIKSLKTTVENISLEQSDENAKLLKELLIFILTPEAFYEESSLKEINQLLPEINDPSWLILLEQACYSAKISKKDLPQEKLDSIIALQANIATTLISDNHFDDGLKLYLELVSDEKFKISEEIKKKVLNITTISRDTEKMNDTEKALSDDIFNTLGVTYIKSSNDNDNDNDNDNYNYSSSSNNNSINKNSKYFTTVCTISILAISAFLYYYYYHYKNTSQINDTDELEL